MTTTPPPPPPPPFALTYEEVAEFERMFDVACWACGNSNWTVSAGTGGYPLTVMHRLSNRPDVSAIPAVAMTCSTCCTLWMLSIDGIRAWQKDGKPQRRKLT